VNQSPSALCHLDNLHGVEIAAFDSSVSACNHQ
jgi:hypothetical protein